MTGKTADTLTQFEPLSEDERLDIDGGRRKKKKRGHFSNSGTQRKKKRASTRTGTSVSRTKKSKKLHKTGTTGTGSKSRKEGISRTDMADRHRLQTMIKAYSNYYDNLERRQNSYRFVERYAYEIAQEFEANGEWGRAYGPGNYCDDNLVRQLQTIGKDPDEYLPLGVNATVEDNWLAIVNQRGGAAGRLQNRITESGTYVFYAINGGEFQREDHTGTVTVNFETNTYSIIHSGFAGDDRFESSMVQRSGVDPRTFLSTYKTVQYIRI